MPEGVLRLLTMADAVVIHLALALVIGSLASEAWMRGRSSTWRRHIGGQAVQARRAGFALGLVGVIAAVWFEAAAMSDAPLWSVGPELASLVGHTHYGHAWLADVAAWLVAGGLLLGRRSGAPRAGGSALGLLALAVFVATRSIVSHAGSLGDFTLDVALDWLHLVLVCAWVGIVLAGARLVLPQEAASNDDRADATRWVSSMSTTATIAIVGIGATGLFKVWRGWASVSSLEPYLVSDYGKALVAKLALVAVAAVLGGFNRFAVLPGLFRSLAVAHEVQDGRWRRRLLAILRVEAGTLLLVLVAAAALSSSELPGTN